MSHRRAPPHIPLITEDTAPIHFEWSKITVWRTVYQTRPKKGKKNRSASNISRVSRGNKKSKKPQLRDSQKRPTYQVTIFSLERPKAQKILKTPSGKRVFEAVSCKREERGFIEKIRNVQPRTVHNPQGVAQTMGKKDTATAEKRSTRAKAKSRKNKDEVEGTEDDDSVDEELAQLEQLADSETDEVEDVDPDTDEDEDTPKKGKKGNKAPRQSRAAKEGKVGTREIAEAGDTDARTLRMVLRKHGPTGTGEVDKDPETGRWEWDSLDHRDVKKILGWLKRGEAKDVKNESLQKLKDQKAKEKAEGGKKGKKDKKGKKNKK